MCLECLLPHEGKDQRCSDDNVIGLFGTPNKNTKDDWMTRDSTTITTEMKRHGDTPYNNCTQNWCMTNHSDSLFTYNEPGMGFIVVTPSLPLR